MQKTHLTPTRCATCDVDLTPRRRAFSTYCCSGCERGGPCTCSYDDAGANVPMSDRAYASLQQDIARTAARLEELGPIANAYAFDGMALSEYYLAASRQRALYALRDRAVITDEPERAALGSHVRYREDDADAAVILVTHGNAAPAVGRISVTSPMGKALLGRRAGEAVTVRTPAGVRVITITAIA